MTQPSSIPPTSSEWDQPSAGSVAQPAGRAAVQLWILAAVELVMFGCLSATASLLAFIPETEIRKALQPGQVSEEQMQMFLQAKEMAIPVALTILILGLIPAIAYVILGFFVRLSRPNAIGTALLLAVTQSIVFGVLFLQGAIAAVMQHNPAQFTVDCLSFGTVLVLLGYAIKWLLRARSSASV